MSSSLFIKFNNAFVTPEPELQSINVWYSWPEIFGYFELCYFASFVIQSKSIIFYADLLYISLYLTINISNIFPLLQWNFDGCRLLQLIYRSFGQFYIFWYCFLWNSKKNKKSEMKQINNNGTFFCPSACLNSSISLLHTHEN